MPSGTRQLFFEDLTVGLRVTGVPRQLTAKDFADFAVLTGDAHPIHYDPAYAAASRFGRCVAHGLLLTSLTALGASPLSAQLHDSMVALLGQTTRFLLPAFVDDVLVATHEVADRQMRDGKSSGRVRFAVSLRRGDEIILDGHHDYAIRLKVQQST
ncbi:MAG: MaoC/PaaZ C-terminal domain-containing protein [Pseudomonadota bacterium]